jgi:uncharacterized membrane protein YidH (DUF202 family)
MLVSEPGSQNNINIMPKVLSLIFLVVGVVLLVFGLNAYHSFSSSVTQAVSGTPTDKSIWLIVGGIAGIIIGGFSLMLSRQP